jgi:hypothetical protein
MEVHVAFGNSSKPSRIFSYGALPPDHEDLVVAQMRVANRYRSALVELERVRRGRALDALRARFPEVPALEAEVEALRERIAQVEAAVKVRNAAARRRRATAEERAELRGLRERRREVYADLKARKAWDDPGLQPDLEAVEKWAKEEALALRARFAHPADGEGPPLYWPTYLEVEDSLRGARRGAPPVFRRFTGEGQVSMQLQKGLPVPDLLACTDTRLRLEVQDAGKRHYRLWLRIGSEGRAPLWAKVPIILHRDLPADARIKWARLLRRHCGTHWRWQVQFVLERDEWPADAASGGACGIDLGWRLVSKGLRVAFWAGDDGRSGELVIPHADLARWRKADDLTSIRDRNFNAARDALAAWVRGGVALADWLRVELTHLHQWRSPARLAALLWRWNGARYERGREVPWQPPPGFEGVPGFGRFPGDGEIFARLWAWRKQDRHLYDWLANNREKAVRWRDDLYRRFARELTGRYYTVVFERTDWREMVALPAADAEGVELRTSNHRIAAVGRLRQFVREKAGEYQEVDPKHTTKRCHACGSLEDFDAARELEHPCSACGEVWDQDHNAAKNLLQAFAAPAASGGIVG